MLIELLKRKEKKKYGDGEALKNSSLGFTWWGTIDPPFSDKERSCEHEA